MNNVRSSVTSAAMVALAVVLPMALHGIPNAGVLLSPMHFPVLLAGLVLGPVYASLVGILAPVASFLISGMPPAPVLPGMIIELFGYGLFTSLSMKLIRTNKGMVDVLISLVIGMVLGRVLGGLGKALIFSRGSYSLALWATGYFVKTFPAIILQLVLLPLIYKSLEKARLIEKRYEEES